MFLLKNGKKQNDRLWSSLSLSRWDGAAAVCAVLYWGLYCWADLDLHFFETVSRKWRLFFLILLMVLAVALRRLLYRAFCQKDEFSRKFLKYTLIHLTLLLLLLLLLCPGTWSWDDIHVLNCARSYSMYPWQHYFSSVAMILSAYFLPSAVGIVVVQLAIIACVVGYCLALLDVLYLDDGKRYRVIALLLAELAFLMPPILFYDYSKFRNTLCSYLELLVLALAWRIVKCSGHNKIFNVMLLLFLTVVVASWRSENFYYALFVLGLLLLVAGRKYWKGCLAATLVTCLAVFAIGQYNTYLIGNDNYAVVAVLNPAITLVRKAQAEPNGLSDEQRTSVEKVIDWDSMMEKPYVSGSTLYWNGGVLPYTQEEYRAFQKTYVELILKYPLTFLQERWTMFWNTLGFNDGQYDPYTRTIRIFEPDTPEIRTWATNGDALNISLREQTLRLLTGRNADGGKNIFNHVFWNLLPPLLFAAAALIYGLVRHKRLMWYTVLCNLLKVPLIFLTAPDMYFMYYMSVYLFGYMAAFFAVAIWFNRKCPAEDGPAI